MLKKLLFILPVLLAGYFAYNYVSDNPIQPSRYDESCPYYKDTLGRFVIGNDEELKRGLGGMEWFLKEEVKLNDFKILSTDGECKATDGNFLFIGSRSLTGVDVNTWVDIGDEYSKDKDHVYYRTEIFEGVDPLTFEILKNEDCSTVKFYAKDINNVYYEQKIVDGADATSFYVACEYGLLLGKDNSSSFQNGEKIRIPDSAPITEEEKADEQPVEENPQIVF